MNQVKDEIVEVVKPHLRGWLHTGIVPVAAVAGIVLVVGAPEGRARWSSVIFALTSLLLFTTSAVYHRGRWSPRSLALLKRIDHSNIYLIIAGSYTPFALLALDPPASTVLITLVWSGAIGGVLFRMLWVDAPRWLYTSLYVVTGWAALLVAPLLVRGAGIGASLLVLLGGVLYTLGAVVYGLQRPDPSPTWFGFHEVFHAFTVAAWTAHYIAVCLVVFD